MTPEAATMHDSGVRRRQRMVADWVNRVLPYILPMAPRKHTQEDAPSMDRSIVAWRGFVTAALLYLAAPTVDRTQNNVERELASMRSSIDRIDSRVTKFIDGFESYQPGARRK